MRLAKQGLDGENGSQTEFRPMRSITVGAIEGPRSGSRTKRSSDLSGAEINDHI